MPTADSMITDPLGQWLLVAKSGLLSNNFPSYDKPTCIFSAPSGLLREYEDAYVPRIVSIGPYHFGKKELREMEIFKGEATRKEVERIKSKTGNNDFSFENLLSKIDSMLGKICRYYDKDMPYHLMEICDNHLVLSWMIARDACFILEFIRCFQEASDPIFGLRSENSVVISEILKDLIKLENQIPLFVLEEVLAMEVVAPNVVDAMEEVVAEIVAGEEACCIERLKKAMEQVVPSNVSVAMEEVVAGEEASRIERLKKAMEEVFAGEEASCTERLKKAMEQVVPSEEASRIERLKKAMEEVFAGEEASCTERLKKAMEQVVPSNVLVVMKEVVAQEDAYRIERLKKAMEEVFAGEEASFIERIKKAMEKVVPWNVLVAMKEVVAREASRIERLKKAMEKASYPERLEKAKSELQILLKPVFRNIYYRPFDYFPDEESPWQNHILDIYYYYCLGEVNKYGPITFRESREAAEVLKKCKFPSAVELNNAGLKIEAKGEKVQDVAFDGKTLFIPPIKFDVDSVVFIRNLIALEICSPYLPSKSFTEYVQFMDELCEREKGVSLMREKMIIIGNLRLPSRIIQLLNFSSLVPFQPTCVSFLLVRAELIKFYRRKCRIASAKLWNEFWNAYVSKPWLVIGGIGATMILLLTAVQVFCLFKNCGAR